MDAKAIVLIGMQGCGKSTYAKELESKNPHMKRLSRDDIRFMMFDLHNYSDNFDELHATHGTYLDYIYLTMTEVIMEQGLTIILDETHHVAESRRITLETLHDIDPDITVEAHYLPIDISLALERNAQRRPEQVVPEDIVRDFQQDLLSSLGGSWSLWDVIAKLTNEGFDNVVVKT